MGLGAEEAAVFTSVGSRAVRHRHWEREQGAGPRRGAIREGVLEAVAFQPGLEECGGCYPAETNRWHCGWGSSTHNTHKVVEAGKTGCAWCVVWDELVDDIFREVGGVSLDCQGPRMLHLIQAPFLPLCFLPSLGGLRTCLFHFQTPVTPLPSSFPPTCLLLEPFIPWP